MRRCSKQWFSNVIWESFNSNLNYIKCCVLISSSEICNDKLGAIDLRQKISIITPTVNESQFTKISEQCYLRVIGALKNSSMGYLDSIKWRHINMDAWKLPYPIKTREGSTKATRPVMIPWSKKPSEVPGLCPVGLNGMRACFRTSSTIL